MSIYKTIHGYDETRENQQLMMTGWLVCLMKFNELGIC